MENIITKIAILFQEIGRISYSSDSEVSLAEFYYQNHPRKTELDFYFLGASVLEKKEGAPYPPRKSL